MSVNKKLFELGNDVVRLHQIVEKVFPASFSDPLHQQSPMREILVEMLRIINIIRIESYQGERQDVKNQKSCDCFQQEVDRVLSIINMLGVKCSCEQKLNSKSE